MENKLVKSNPFEQAEKREAVKPRRIEKDVTPDPIPEEPKQEKQKPATDILAELTNKKPTGKGYNVYLDADVIEKLDRLAKQAKTSRSKVINLLLRSHPELNK